MFQVFFLTVLSLVASTHQLNPVIDELPMFKEQSKGSIGVLTTSAGAPIVQEQVLSSLNTNLNRNPYFIDTLTHFVRENIPERIVHMKGAGAFGYFEVTENITDICGAEFLDTVGKKTPVVARFSVGVTGKGGPDTTATPMGFAIRFYTQEGNLDLLGLNLPLFAIKDPLRFPDLIHVLKLNPRTNVADVNMLWDYASTHPESLYMFLILFGDRGIHYSYINMPSYPIETFQVHNAAGKRHFIRFNIMPQAGLKYLNSTEAANLACSNPDYYTKTLYTAIADGEFPKWNVGVQILTEEDVKNAKFDVFDTSKILPESVYPSKTIGEIVLNTNPLNYFTDIEQLAFSPANLVPKIQGSPSKVSEARFMFYSQAHSHRLGTNYNKIKVNRPYKASTCTYGRDGAAPAGDNGGASPNYNLNHFNGCKARENVKIPPLLEIQQDEPDNFDQAREYFMKEMSSGERLRFVDTVISTLCYAADDVQKRTVQAFAKVHQDLSDLVANALKKKGC